MPDVPSPEPQRKELLASTSTWTRRQVISLTFLIWIILFLLIIYLLSFIQTALWVLIIAGLVAYAVLPLVGLLHHLMPRLLAVLLVYIVIVGFVFFLLYLLIEAGIAQITALAQSVRSYLTPGPHGHVSPLLQIVRRFGVSQEQLATLTRDLENYLSSTAAHLAENVFPFVSRFLEIISLILFTIVISIYLILDGDRFIQVVRRNAPRFMRPGTGRLIQILRDVVGGYIRGEILLCIIIGVLVGLGMFILGVPYPIFLGILASFLEFIPVVGVLISGAICCLLALTQGWLLVLIVLAYFIGIHVVEGYVLVPRIMGRAIGLHPALTLLAVIAGNELLGLMGAILAGPLAGLIQSVLASFWLYYRETHQTQFADSRQPAREHEHENEQN
ncbi:MAG TPA: AI-2E family transporter [Ktedonobacteraceae bacterium]|nr:AI-2E family transporter [Ktedonobacteraceae bacterium]